MEKLFSYGTLQQDQVQLDTFGRRLVGVPDQLVGYLLKGVEIQDAEVIARSGKVVHPIAVFSGHPDDRVSGTVFDITYTELMHSDAYEVNDYARIAVKLASGVLAWAYVALDSAQGVAET